MFQEKSNTERLSAVTLELAERAGQVILYHPKSTPLVLDGCFLGKEIYRIATRENPNLFLVHTLRLFDEAIAQESGIALELQISGTSQDSDIWEHNTVSFKLDGSKINTECTNLETFTLNSPVNPLQPADSFNKRGPITDFDVEWFDYFLGSFENK